LHVGEIRRGGVNALTAAGKGKATLTTHIQGDSLKDEEDRCLEEGEESPF
jgi:hypothetical protein